MSVVQLCQEESFQVLWLLGWSKFEVIQVSLMKFAFFIYGGNSMVSVF
jgi:hypothetical protein